MSTIQASFKEFKDSDYSKFRKELLRDKGNERQRQFLEIVRDTDAFLDHVSAIPTDGTVNADLAPERMTENEYKDPPYNTERTLYTSWEVLTPAVACRSTFWANLTVEHIRAGRIQSVYLAANGGNLLDGAARSGAARIDFVLHNPGEQGSKWIDDCVRTVLRRLGGLPEVRGNRSVYVDCPFARAWWCERMVNQAANGDAQMAEIVRSVIRNNQTYWEKLIDRIVFRNSTFGSDNIRNAFLRALALFVQSNQKSDLKSSQGLQRLCRRITTYQGSRELSILSDSELDVLMGAVVNAT